jgi:long-chain acyl-CoA synthetase
MRTSLASLVEDFRKHARETAVVAHRGVRRYPTTYGELAELAGRFAAELERRRVGPGERVVLWGTASAEWIGVFFGCLLRGVMVVPLDAAGDAGFAARVVEDVGARLVVGDGEQLAALASCQLSVVSSQLPAVMELRGIGARLGGEPLWAVSEAVGLDTPFQIVFTSGTTSEPRGIVHTHRNVLVTLEPIERELKKYRRAERLFHPLRFLHSLPLSHVFGQFMGLWCPALLAAEVHFAEDLEPARVVELIRRERISVLVAVPRVQQLLRGHLLGRFAELQESSQLSVLSSQKERGTGERRTKNSQLTTVVKKLWRWRRVHRALGWKFWAVISGGATLPAELEAFWDELGYALIQGYGMTETAALVTLNHPFHIARGTIGKALPGREVKIAEDGEILVRGAMLAPATWERGAMRQREGEWLATGDLAETSASGELKFAGRKGDVIVTGAGMNVHPADLEKAVAAQAGVRGCVVVGCEFHPSQQAGRGPQFSSLNGPEAVAAVLFSGTDAELAAAVQEANRGLAEFQQIRHWVRWPQLTFPYTSTGKVIRREVAAWVSGRFGGANPTRDDKAVTNGAPGGVMGVVAEVTGEAVTGDADSLRLSEDLKLDSLGRVQLQSALEQRFDVELDEDALAAVETVGELRRMVEENVVRSALHVDRRAAVDGGAPSTLSVESAEAERHRGAWGHVERTSENGEQSEVYPRWAWWWWVRWVRVVWIEAVMRPLVWVLARPKIGESASQQVSESANDGPVLVVCNHVTAYDGALVLYALPGKLRRRVACAMSGEMLMDYRKGLGQGNWALNMLAPGAWLLLTALFNVFPLPRARGFRRSFAYAGAAMDRGYSVLIFPEGSRSRDGKMHAFRPGIGLLAKESGAAIVPVGLRGMYEPGRWFHAGKVEVRVGEGVPAVDEGADAAEVTARLEAAVRRLLEGKNP